MTGDPAWLDETAADLLGNPAARRDLVSDPRRWCLERSLGPEGIAQLTMRIRRLADGLEPADRRVVLATCFALGSVVRP